MLLFEYVPHPLVVKFCVDIPSVTYKHLPYRKELLTL